MNTRLSPLEARIIGCLLEKEITTPDQYPLSLNALVNACNQKSNRDPMLELDERAVQDVVDALAKRHLLLERSGFGSRVPKYQHRFCNTDFGSLKFSEIELAILCELLLRGPQTPGELRGRANRMATVSDVEAIEAALRALATRTDGPFVVQLPREPGRRDSRWAQLFTELPDGALQAGHPAAQVGQVQAQAGKFADTSFAAPAGLPAPAPSGVLEQRINALEERCAALEQRLAQLEAR